MNNKDKITDAYNKWVNAIDNETRAELWLRYCDIRDGLPTGSTKKKLEKVESGYTRRVVRSSVYRAPESNEMVVQ